MFIDDLDIFFADSGVTATIGVTPIPVIFDAPYKGISIETNEIESYAPTAMAKSTDVAARSIAHGTSITISDTPCGEYDGTYKCIAMEPDGQGMTKLILERQ